MRYVDSEDGAVSAMAMAVMALPEQQPRYHNNNNPPPPVLKQEGRAAAGRVGGDEQEHKIVKKLRGGEEDLIGLSMAATMVPRAPIRSSCEVVGGRERERDQASEEDLYAAMSMATIRTSHPAGAAAVVASDHTTAYRFPASAGQPDRPGGATLSSILLSTPLSAVVAPAGNTVSSVEKQQLTPHQGGPTRPMHAVSSPKSHSKPCYPHPQYYYNPYQHHPQQPPQQPWPAGTRDSRGAPPHHHHPHVMMGPPLRGGGSREVVMPQFRPPPPGMGPSPVGSYGHGWR